MIARTLCTLFEELQAGKDFVTLSFVTPQEEQLAIQLLREMGFNVVIGISRYMIYVK